MNKRKKILIANGEVPTLISIERALEDNFDVILNGSGKSLLQQINIASPDALVIDSRIGDIDGMDLIVEIKKSFPRLPTIMFSSHHVCKDDPRTLAADHYLPKSSGLSELTRKIERALEI